MIRTTSAGLLATAITALFLLNLPSTFAAEEAARPNEARVVLIGISDYADKQIKPRKHAEDDAKALFDLFSSKEYLGVDAKHIRLLLGKADEKRGSQPATRENILKAVEWLAEGKRDDLTLF